MKINHYIYIKTKVSNPSRLLMKLYKLGINIYDVIKKDNVLYLKILYQDYPKIKQKIFGVSFTITTDTGIYRLKKSLTSLKITCFILFIFLLNLCSSFIIKINIIHSNKEIRALVQNALEENGIKLGSFKKNYTELQTIKTKIINTYQDQIEWLEIEAIGMTYTIRIEERIINKPQNEEKYCHIVALKSGIISHIESQKGEVLVKNGHYVTKNDRLISGEIKFNDEVKNNVCAKGNIYAEVWYTTTVHLPLNYETKTKTGKMRYNIALETPNNKYKIFKSRLKNYETQEKKLFTFLNFTLYLYQEYEITTQENKYDLESGLQKALKLADEKITLNHSQNERINTRKVLKKTLNNSTIDIEIFYSVIENITKVEEYSITEEKEGS